MLGCVPGATLTPHYEQTTDHMPKNWMTRPMQADEVTEQALQDLGRYPARASGLRNRVLSGLLARLLPSRTAIELVSRETGRMYD